jgi:hypothetical protein
MPAGAGNGGRATNEATASKGSNMKYQKPKVVAKSAAKQTFAAGCPEKTVHNSGCSLSNQTCMCGSLR